MIPIIGEGTERDPLSIQLATRDGSYIPNFRTPELAPEIHRSAAEMFGRERAEAQLRSSTSLYNCVGQMFASRRTWVEIDYLQSILERDGYRRVNERKNLWIGDVVVYENREGEITHVGLVVEKRLDVKSGNHVIYVLSKWGQNGEYFHQMDDVPPLLGNPVKFWTERREV
jgi:hypothetical protein